MQRTVKKFTRPADADKADREFYRNLSGNERLQILVELLNHAPEQRLERIIELLNSRGVEYVIVGAHSLAFHGRPRYTGDLDILVQATKENAIKLVGVLREFGFDEGFKTDDFTQPEQVIQLGRPPNRIDLLTSITGVTNEEALATKLTAELDGLPVSILSKEALIKNKRAVGRPQDLADLAALED